LGEQLLSVIGEEKLNWITVTFASVAWLTSSHKIVLPVRPSFFRRDQMIKLVRVPTDIRKTVNTLSVVAFQNLKPPRRISVVVTGVRFSGRWDHGGVTLDQTPTLRDFAREVDNYLVRSCPLTMH
jgi:hypothetical protein